LKKGGKHKGQQSKREMGEDGGEKKKSDPRMLAAWSLTTIRGSAQRGEGRPLAAGEAKSSPGGIGETKVVCTGDGGKKRIFKRGGTKKKKKKKTESAGGPATQDQGKGKTKKIKNA